MILNIYHLALISKTTQGFNNYIKTNMRFITPDTWKREDVKKTGNKIPNDLQNI